MTETTMTMMKATQCSDFGPIDQVLTVVESKATTPEDDVGGGVPIPKLTDEYVATEPIHPMIQSASKKDRQTHMIIRTLAVALAPGDIRILSGKTRELQGPPSLPYIPGGDCCGIVVETQPNESYFQPGDVVAVRFSNAPRDALAEYARVSSTVCEKIEMVEGDQKPKISPIEAAALASASPAVQLAEYIQPQTDQRILILGGGGGIGSHLVQLIRYKFEHQSAEASSCFICGTSSTPQRLLEAPLKYDKAIDYTKDNVFAMEVFQNQPFDVIIDLACGGWIQLQEHYDKGNASIIKPASQGGRFITPTTDASSFEMHNLPQAITKFMIQPMLRSLSTNPYNPFNLKRSKMPAFINSNDCLPNDRHIITKTLQLAYDKKLQAVVDGPYPMTTDGVRQAFKVAESRHPKGKVVIQVAEA